MTKKKEKKDRERGSRKAEYELFFKRQTLLLDLSPRIKVKSKKKRMQRVSVKGRVIECERDCVRERAREKVSERREAERKMRKRERGALISECILCICYTRRDCHHLTDKKIHM